MNDKKLQQKLEKKTQQIIEGADCKKCGKMIVYILCGHGTDELFYDECDAEKIHITSQDGRGYTGYETHKCIRFVIQGTDTSQ